MVPEPRQAGLNILAFDVFGTVVDWRGSVARETRELCLARGLNINAEKFADAWRNGYAPAMDRVRKGLLPWMKIDQLHRLILDEIIPEFGLESLLEPDRQYLNGCWHRLAPWPDSVDGLTRLKRRFTITTLSNGNFSLLTNMAKNAGLPWDCIVSAELFKHYKPDPETYLGLANLLDVNPEEVMLVASHPSDLRAAKAQGLKTAYVRRPLEMGEGSPLPEVFSGEFDWAVDDFNDLADQLKK
ncbi:haloacid dehalogenase type II [Limnobacter litoralis]|uniref:(S)-2-haloacid dehalogenase n=1 Tax=Limnobacter litoralis TaxID=481366 RepID=A0ABQ5YTQ4_9BURK|nr:haloacid dehalogenase type II [Limnobacter litoralis]GLR27524.1 haloacid dehalogenase [Limnobacter litoralis]